MLDLKAFESRVKAATANGPVHLSGGNEKQLIEIFKDISRDDWVFSTYRSHYHALLHGLPEEYVFQEIIEGRSISLQGPKFYTSAIVGGCLPIALGLAAVGQRSWVFCGDMAASCGTFHDCLQYATCKDLPITFVIEDNGMSTYTPTMEAWGSRISFPVSPKVIYYKYESTEPHIGYVTNAIL